MLVDRSIGICRQSRPMTTYVIAFEVSAAKREEFVSKLKAYGSYCPINAGCWAVSTAKGAAQIRDELMVGMTSSDRVFVIRSGTEAAWVNSYGENHNTWLKNNL